MCLHCEGISGQQSITYCAEQKKRKKLNSASDLAQVQHKLYQVHDLERQSRQQKKWQNRKMVDKLHPVHFSGSLISPLVCAGLQELLKNKKISFKKLAEADYRFYWRPVKAGNTQRKSMGQVHKYERERPRTSLHRIFRASFSHVHTLLHLCVLFTRGSNTADKESSHRKVFQ